MLFKKFQNNIKDIVYCNERILKVVVKIRGIEYVILSVYAPTDDARAHIKDAFFSALATHMTVNSNQFLVVAGDCNGKVGVNAGNGVMGQFGDPEINDNGERIIELCAQNSFSIWNTWFSHKEVHRYTWTRPTLGQKSIADQIITWLSDPYCISTTADVKAAGRGLEPRSKTQSTTR